MTKKNFKYDNWFFPKMSPSSQRGKTLTSSNFNKEDKDLIDIFFREYIQNVMDARIINAAGERQSAFLSIKLIDVEAEIVGKYLGNVLPRLIEAGHSKERLESAVKSARNKVACLVSAMVSPLSASRVKLLLPVPSLSLCTLVRSGGSKSGSTPIRLVTLRVRCTRTPAALPTLAIDPCRRSPPSF